MTSLMLFTLLGLARGNFTSNPTSQARDSGRLLNVFSIVSFPNDGCAVGSRYGVCYTASECAALGGSSSGSCAQGFGVCCSFSGGCGGTTSVNNTYFASSDDDTSGCTFTVCKATDNICQFRLNFDTFSLHQPATDYETDDDPSGRTQCKRAQFSATSAGGSTPTICGSNTGQHMIIEAADACNQLAVMWTKASPRAWDIHIVQIACDDRHKPPEGCTQYHTGTTGYLQSYNWAGGYHLANMNYNHCIRTERGYCYMQYYAAAGDFAMDGTVAGGATGSFSPSTTGNTCVDGTSVGDRVIITGGAASLTASTTGDSVDRYCGGYLNSIASTAAATVYTSRQPFMVGVVTNGNEQDDNNPDVEEMSKGFNIQYTQVAC